LAVVAPGEDGRGDDEQSDERGHEAVGVLNDGLLVVRGHGAAVACRPVGAAEARARRAYEHADTDQHEGGENGGEGEALCVLHAVENVPFAGGGIRAPVKVVANGRGTSG
jgi:hypothetical protein